VEGEGRKKGRKKKMQLGDFPIVQITITGQENWRLDPESKTVVRYGERKNDEKEVCPSWQKPDVRRHQKAKQKRKTRNSPAEDTLGNGGKGNAAKT